MIVKPLLGRRVKLKLHSSNSQMEGTMFGVRSSKAHPMLIHVRARVNMTKPVKLAFRALRSHPSSLRFRIFGGHLSSNTATLPIADEGFGMHGTCGSFAEVGRFSVDGIGMNPRGSGLVRITEALHGLVSGLAKSLNEFQDVEDSFQLEAAAGIGSGVDEPEGTVSLEVKLELLLAVAGSLKAMVSALVSDIKANAQVQKLMPAIRNTSGGEHHGFFQEFMNIPKHQHSSSREET